MTESPGSVLGVLLAGGQSLRMGGGDKCLRQLGGQTLLARIIARARPQVSGLMINANGDPARFAAYGLPVVADSIVDFPGPLAGILSGLDWAALHRPQRRYIATFPADAPFVPRDLVSRLAAAIESGAEIALAASGGQAHPVVGLWPVALRADLRRALTEEGIRKVDRWTGRYKQALVDFPVAPIDPFFNVNSPADLAEAEALLAQSA